MQSILNISNPGPLEQEEPGRLIVFLCDYFYDD